MFQRFMAFYFLSFFFSSRNNESSKQDYFNTLLYCTIDTFFVKQNFLFTEG